MAGDEVAAGRLGLYYGTEYLVINLLTDPRGWVAAQNGLQRYVASGSGLS